MSLRERLAGVATITHRDGPETERIAAHLITDTGTRERVQARVVAYVRAHPGLSALEIARGLGLHATQARPRLTEAERAGLIRTGKRELRPGLDGVSLRSQMTYWPVEAEPRQLRLGGGE